jgi:transcriptional regulator with XRE-family HTH domain
MQVTETVYGGHAMNMLHWYTMGNNLKYFIKLSGKTQIEVAKLKGIQPESLSRHISGRSQFSIQDAMEYAEILGCSPEQLLFEQKPINVIGTLHNDYSVVMNDNSMPVEQVQMNVSPNDSWALIRRKFTDASYADDSFMIIDTVGIQQQRVQNGCFGNKSICKDKDGNISMVLVYPQPDGKFSLASMSQSHVQQNIELVWACPVLSIIVRPDLLGWQSI